MTEVKKINVSWTLNGFPYSRRRARIDDDYNLGMLKELLNVSSFLFQCYSFFTVIPKASERDSGVYLCTAYQKPESIPSKVIIDVYSLIVNRSHPTKKIRKGRSLTLRCNGLALSYIYGDLSQKWEINGTVWKNYGITTLETVKILYYSCEIFILPISIEDVPLQVNLDKLENITDVHDGVWTCVIEHEDLGFKWKTNWMHIKGMLSLFLFKIFDNRE